MNKEGAIYSRNCECICHSSSEILDFIRSFDEVLDKTNKSSKKQKVLEFIGLSKFKIYTLNESAILENLKVTHICKCTLSDLKKKIDIDNVKKVKFELTVSKQLSESILCKERSLVSLKIVKENYFEGCKKENEKFEGYIPVSQFSIYGNTGTVQKVNQEYSVEKYLM